MKLMRGLCAFLAILFCPHFFAAQKTPADPVNLLDHVTGSWVLRGTIAGKQTTHDVQATWVLNREYVQLHEVSREKNASGRSEYEAIVYLSWEAKTHEYNCLWLDSTAGGGLSAEGIARGKLAGDSIPLVFALSSSDQIHTTFTYDKASDSWRWLIDNVENGQTRRFADVALTRAK